VSAASLYYFDDFGVADRLLALDVGVTERSPSPLVGVVGRSLIAFFLSRVKEGGPS